MFKLLNYIIAWFRVPKGSYCYTILSINDKTGCIQTKNCKYYCATWYGDANGEYISYCKYLDMFGGFSSNADMLLWDQCKVCGIKETVI